MLKFYKKLTKMANILFYFSTQDWTFNDDGVQNMWRSISGSDQTVFPFNIGDFSWEYMTETFLVGLRVYLINDDISTLPEAKRKWDRLYYLHQFVKVTAFSLVIFLGYLLVKGLIWIVFGL
uniref:Putative fatty acyl-CoA reductase n=3 Tax=Pararge aegeria TaxID=116150 RepID=S4PDT4_9NEOP